MKVHEVKVYEKSVLFFFPPLLKTQVSGIAGGFFTRGATREVDSEERSGQWREVDNEEEEKDST